MYMYMYMYMCVYMCMHMHMYRSTSKYEHRIEANSKCLGVYIYIDVHSSVNICMAYIYICKDVMIL